MNWKVVEDSCQQIDLWIATPSEATVGHTMMMQALGDYVDQEGFCVTATRTFFRYTGGTELGLKIGIRNYPRFPLEWDELIGHAERIGFKIAEAGGQDTFMIEDGSAVYWFTRNPEHLSEDHDWKNPVQGVLDDVS